ncbi:MAG: LacI family DNA-binding transcriptional regulator [Candidatus Methylacidiphilales bacterium]|nr:LacI family DNA-binding transcriptional regulator [Candidatus Methylacidiphilales bacterium]
MKVEKNKSKGDHAGPPTYRDLARKAGVSVAAVSMALRNRPGVSEKTRARILQLAKDENYRVNPLVTALMVETRQRRKNGVRAIMGILSHGPLDSPESYREHYGKSEYLRGATAAASEHGYALEQFDWKDLHADMRSFQRALYTRRMVGLLIHLSEPPPAWFKPEWENYAVASVGNVIHLPELDAATHDHFSGLQMALRHVHAMGHRRVTLVLDKEAQRLQEYRYLSAYTGAPSFLPKLARIPPLLADKITPEQVLEHVRENKTTVVICADHLVYHWLEKGGYRIPKDISFIHLDRDYRWNHIAGIEQNSFDTGSAAVELVVSRINRNQYGIPQVPHVTMIEGRWVDGPSIRPLGDA